jgi:phosphatidylglycerol:prolipoprotein diacylglycerol transferase
MFPELLDLGIISIKTYGVCMALGFFLSWKVLEKLSGRKDLADLLVYLMITGVVGSRIAYVIENWESAGFSSNFLEVFRVDKGGLVFYGGLILSMILFFVWCAVKKIRPIELADLLCVAMPLGHACGRIGCFFYGCCWGKVSSSPIAVSFPQSSPVWHEQISKGLIPQGSLGSLPVIPTQLIEATALFALFALLVFLYRKYRKFTAGVYLSSYAVIRFFIEYLRGDPRANVFHLSIGQSISLGMFLVGVFLFVCSWRSSLPNKEDTNK